jgi:aminoglycoside phosphotransferase (APT) family kinase protein
VKISGVRISEDRRVNPPASVFSAVAAATGTRPSQWQHVVAGHTHAEKWFVELEDGRTAFVKAGTETSARVQIEREAAILESIGATYMPGLYGAVTADDWSVLVLEDLRGAVWPPPYPDRGAALFETVLQVAATPGPDGLQRRPEGRPLGTYWRRIAADPEPVLAHGLFSADWLEQAQPVLDAAEAKARLAGDDFLHDDVWAENVCYTQRGAILIDWASATIGDRRIDLAYALLSIRSSGAAPPPVDFPEEAAYAALLAGANAYQAAQPVDESIQYAATLRAGWLYDLEFALAWVCDLLDLEPP